MDNLPLTDTRKIHIAMYYHPPHWFAFKDFARTLASAFQQLEFEVSIGFLTIEPDALNIVLNLSGLFFNYSDPAFKQFEQQIDTHRNRVIVFNAEQCTAINPLFVDNPR